MGVLSREWERKGEREREKDKYIFIYMYIYIYIWTSLTNKHTYMFTHANDFIASDE